MCYEWNSTFLEDFHNILKIQVSVRVACQLIVIDNIPNLKSINTL